MGNFLAYGFQFGLLPAGDEDFSTVLDEALSSHFTNARGPTGYQSYMFLEREEALDTEVGGATGVCHVGCLVR